MDKQKELLAFIIIFLVSFAVFANTLANGFVYDDAKQILANIWITDVRYLPDIFTHDVWGFWPERESSSYYRPLMHTINLAVYQAGGFSPWAYHLVNILFHCGNSALVFALALHLCNKAENPSAPSLAFIAGLLFAAHPIHSEAVAWAGGLPDLSYTFFLLLSFYLYLRSAENSGASPLLFPLSVLSFALALLAKEPALMLPLMLILHDYAENKNRLKQQLRGYIPYFILAAAYLAIRFAVIGKTALSGQTSSLFSWLPDVPVLFAAYLGKLILPINLNAYYSYSPAGSFLTPAALTGLAVVFAFTTALVVSLRRSRLVFTGLLFIAVPLLPALYIPAIGGTPFAERYLYLPSFGYVILLSFFISWIAGRVRQYGTPLFLIAGFGIAVIYTAAVFARNQVWKNDFTLWNDTVRKSPDSVIARNNLGRAYFTGGDVDRAIEQYRAALVLNPGHAEAHNNLGAAYATKNMKKEAEHHFLTALRLKPGYADAHNNMGIFYGGQGQKDKAISHFKSALLSRPDFADAHHNLGVTYMAQGLIDPAIHHFQSALGFNPGAVNTHLNLARAYEQKGLLEEARKHRIRAQVLVEGRKDK